MRKDDNDWSLTKYTGDYYKVEINQTHYEVDDNTAALCHAILLLVDAVNDKPGCKYGKEMDTGCDKASRCAEENPRCQKGRKDSCC